MSRELPSKKNESEKPKKLLTDALSGLRDWINRLIKIDDNDPSDEDKKAFLEAAKIFNQNPDNFKNPDALLELALMARPVSPNGAKTYCSIALAYDKNHSGAKKLMEELDK